MKPKLNSRHRSLQEENFCTIECSSHSALLCNSPAMFQKEDLSGMEKSLNENKKSKVGGWGRGSDALSVQA